MSIIVHASCVAKGAAGVLLLGDSGSGKSDLALRLIHEGWRLVCDDRTVLKLSKTGLAAAAPTSIQGLLEVRGLGIVAVAAKPARLKLAVQLGGEGPRLPEAEYWTPHGLEGSVPLIRLPLIRLNGRHASDTAKISLALKAFSQGLFRDTFVTK
jgi:HPr kinase/phosphorylase